MLQLLWEKQSKFQKGTIESSVFWYSELFGCILCVYKEKKHTKKQPTQAYYQHFVVYKKKTEIN